MTSEALLRAIGNISDDLLESAEEPPVRRANQWVRWGAMAAALVIVAGLALAIHKLTPPLSGKSTESETAQEDAVITTEEAPASAEGAMEVPEAPAEEEIPTAESEMEEPMAEYTEPTDSSNYFYPADGAMIALFPADSFEPLPDGSERKITGTAMPDTLIGLSLTDTADEYVYGDGQIIVTVTETDLNTLEDGYLSDFVTDGEKMYLTADNVSYIGGRAVFVGETTDGIAAQTVVTIGESPLLVSIRFAADIEIDQAVSAITELCSGI